MSIEVRLAKPLELVDDDGAQGTRDRAKLVGFVQELAVRADDEALARQAVAVHVAAYPLGPEQSTEMIVIEIAELEDGEAPADARGVWFESARSFYSVE